MAVGYIFLFLFQCTNKTTFFFLSKWKSVWFLISCVCITLCSHLPWLSESLGEYNVCTFLLLKETGGDKRKGEESGAVYNLCESCQYPPICSGWTRPVCKVSLWLFVSLRVWDCDALCTTSCPSWKGMNCLEIH